MEVFTIIKIGTKAISNVKQLNGKNKENENKHVLIKVLVGILISVVLIVAAVCSTPEYAAKFGIEYVTNKINSGGNQDISQTDTIAENISLDNADVVIYSNGLPIPHFKQTDPAWKDHPYGMGKTISSSGCGPTCAAMVISYFTQTYITPVTTCNFSLENNCKVKGGTSWDFFSKIMTTYEINVTQTDSMDEVMIALSEQKPVISSMKPGTFTKYGHFIVLRGLDESGNILVNDPSDSSKKNFYNKSFTPTLIAAESKQFWICSKGEQQ